MAQPAFQSFRDLDIYSVGFLNLFLIHLCPWVAEGKKLKAQVLKIRVCFHVGVTWCSTEDTVSVLQNLSVLLPCLESKYQWFSAWGFTSCLRTEQATSIRVNVSGIIFNQWWTGSWSLKISIFSSFTCDSCGHILQSLSALSICLTPQLAKMVTY